MNPDQPSREQVEARLTALLLGELPAEEAELLRWTIAQDPELQKLHDQLKVTIGFVREAMKNPAGAPVEKETALKMSAERRQTLLAHFKTDRPKPLVPPLRRKMSPLILTLVVVAIFALLAAVLLPVLNTAQIRSLHMVGNLSGVDDMQQLTASAGLDRERKKFSASLQPTTPAVTRTPQESTTPPPLVQIVLPKTESSQTEQDIGGIVYTANVVGYVNVSPGVSAVTPEQPEPNSVPIAVTPIPASPAFAPPHVEPEAQPIVVTALPSASAPTQLRETKTKPIVTGENFTASASEPNSAPVVEAPSAASASPPSQAVPQNAYASAGTFPSTAPAPVPPTGSIAEKALKDRNYTYGGGVGGIGGGGGGGAYANNALVVSGQVHLSPGNVGFAGGAIESTPFASRLQSVLANATNGTPWSASNFNFDNVTNAIAENHGTFYRSFNNSTMSGDRNVGGEGNSWSALTPREQPNANGVIQNNDKLQDVIAIPDSTALPVVAENAPASMAPPPQQPRGQYEYRVTNSSEGLALLGALPQQSQQQIVQVERAWETSGFVKQAEPLTPPQNNPANNEMIPAGLIDFQGADVSQVLEVYAQLTGRTLLSSGLPQGQIVLKNETPLTRAEAIETLQRALALQGIAVINVGDKFVKVIPVSEAGTAGVQTDKPLPAPMVTAPVPQPEIQTRDNAFSTFSLNVSDVSFKLAAASLGNGQMPSPDSIRSEEFINAFDYRDPEPLQGQPLSFMSERARDPFAQERDFLRFYIKAAAAGRQEGRALNLVLLLDTSGSMERADRVAIIREALRVLAAQLQPQDTVSVVTFARTARLWADGVPGGFAGVTLEKVGSITPEGGTNLEEAMRLAYETARRHFIAGGMNRVVLLTDGAANLGNVDPQALTHKVESERRQGIALDCFGIGWEDYNDDMLQQLSSNGDGRYAFINSPDEAGTEFAAKLAGALQVAAEDVKVQVEFNPDRVTAWRQIGYAKHQLTKEQFRDNTVAAGAIASREAGNAVYVIKTKPDGEGPIATVRVRYRVPGTQDNRERNWLVDYAGTVPALAQASPAMRLAATAAEFPEWLSDSPYAQNVTPDDLLNYLSGIPQIYGADERPKQLEWMIRQAKSVSGK